MEAAEPYLDYARKFARASLPRRPRKWVKRSGWTKYHSDGTSEAIEAPDEALLTFDTEVMWKETNFACMACAASPTAWYAWISPWLLEESESDRHLIPLGDASKPRIVIGHNIGYDRARIAEEYSIQQSKNFFLDTMSLHVAVNGMCSRQRPTWEKHRKSRELQEDASRNPSDADLSAILADQEEELWVGRSSINSLRDVAKFHCDITIDKARREYFGELDRGGIREKFDELLDYCAADVDITHRVYQRVFPNFLETCPHPVSFAALRHLSAEILPVDKSWEAYITNAEATYNKLSKDVQDRLLDLARKSLKIKDKKVKYESDPWLSQLDWSGQEVKMVKGKKKTDPPRPAARQKHPGMPNWFKELHPTANSEINLTVRTRLAALLLRLAWDGYPLFWTDKFGFTFRVPNEEAAIYRGQGMWQCDFYDDEKSLLRNDRKHMYFKLPHKDGPLARCTNPLAKGYLQYFEAGRLSSDYKFAKEALQMNASCSYWISARDRIMSQMVVYSADRPPNSTKVKRRGRPRKNQAQPGVQGFILPQIIPMGTITRRAVENTWLTASNAKPNRVGSELKAMIKAPPGYCFVGADVDSEELWIASLVGDAQFQLHGGNAIGFMTLEGSKAAGTDLHSRTANILGISRNDAKVFNYGRIYGAGQRFATQLLRQFNPMMSDSQASGTSINLYAETKGKKVTRKILRDRAFWRGGTESFVFNKLEDFAEEDSPRTPVLGAGITEALMRRYLTKGGFLTSRINWAIQSSGVDYLHLLIVAMEYLTRRFDITARLAITVHDEIRYLVKEEDKYRAAMALQVANVWTRAMFAQQMGMNELPQACAYFSAVDIDHVLRKEVDMDCVTPSHPKPIPPGESLDITQLLQKGSEAQLSPKIVPKDLPDVDKFNYVPRVPVMKSGNDSTNVAYIKAQMAKDNAELNDIVKELKAGAPPQPEGKTSSRGPTSTRTRRASSRKARLAQKTEEEPLRLHYQAHTASLLPVHEWNGRQFFRNWESTKKNNGWVNMIQGPASASHSVGRV